MPCANVVHLWTTSAVTGEGAPHSGRLKRRAMVPERTLARVCREAGALVRFNVKLRDMNVTVPVDDDRAIEVLASGLPMRHGAQLAIDITLRSATSANGLPRRNAAHRDGAVLTQARADKEAKYAELEAGNRCFLVVIALETGGRSSGEAVEFIDMLAGARAREVLPPMRSTLGVETSVDAHAGCVLGPRFRDVLGGSRSGCVEWH